MTQIMDFGQFKFIDIPDHGRCLPGIQAMIYIKICIGANYVGLRNRVLTYEVYGCPEQVIQPVFVARTGWLYPIGDVSFVQEHKTP